ncbi:SPFH domain-containing protein [Streptomyces sp. NBC_01352]|uniref:SPFH domain-containing protein n=1 Tax=unclassified Streptomyces TaxID=2593676 RepID=UPI00224E2B69|nr:MULTISPECIES: SPFH domain-containing protein [unclassified Streptomyces]MCX4700478.1 SPFH domain-containing protein [Streptomyces sp. NBC_01373]
MSTTTSHTPEHVPEHVPEHTPEHIPEHVPERIPERVPESEGPSRPARLIQNEATTEIPVHLLFRDEPDPVSVPLKPAVVGRRQGTGEQPRFRRPVPSKPRPAPEVDPALRERSARVLPGAAGVFAGVCGAAGCVVTSWWAGALPPLAVQALGLPSYAGAGLGPAQWAAYAGAGALGLFGFGGLARGRTGRAWVLGLFGRYRGTVRRTGLLWVNPLLLRRRVDVRLRHWRSEPMPAADASGVALRAVVLVVWRVRDTARATLGVEDHETYLRECVEAGLARVPVEMPGSGRGSADTAGDALTRMVAADAAPVGVEVFSVQPVRLEYAPEVASAMHRRRIAALDAQHRATVLTSVVDSVEDTVTRLTMRGLVELDDYERKALVKDLTVAFCAGRGEATS